MLTFETLNSLKRAIDAGTFLFKPEYGPASFRCHWCCELKPLNTDGMGGTGYGQDGAEFVCYECCGKRDARQMEETGKACLYLTGKPGSYRVTNWPNSLSFAAPHYRHGRHNIARTRYDVWFTGPDGAQWHGVTYGDNTQICHCKRLAH